LAEVLIYIEISVGGLSWLLVTGAEHFMSLHPAPMLGVGGSGKRRPHYPTLAL
jgi:hypothetical protein